MECLYYQGRVERDKIWFVVGLLRNEDHICFERALDKKTGLFEFFVPKDQEEPFLFLMNYLINKDFVTCFEQREIA
ncbi:hypothetical protein EBZ39_12290 [bacterium]|nr:hypothetical protein [bacterium]